MKAEKNCNAFPLIFIAIFLLASSSGDCNTVWKEDHNNLTISSTDHTFITSMVAGFAGRHPVKGTMFHVVVPRPSSYGCDFIDPPPQDRLKAQHWIVLIKRKPWQTDCSFEEKVRNAQKAGYDAALVYQIAGLKLVPMLRFPFWQGDTDDISIPAFFISYDDGIRLASQHAHAQAQGKPLLITFGDPFDASNFIEKYFLTLMKAACFLATHVCLPTILFGILRAERQRIKRLTSWLEILPIIKFTNGDRYEKCAICLEEYINGDELRILHCSHAYHRKCVDEWLIECRRVCPLCNKSAEQ